MSQTLPPLYHRWATEALGRALPQETQATCHDCLLLSPELPEGRRFSPQSKCCTYTPRLPNYLVGQILNDPSSEPAHRHIRARLRSGVGVHPLGLELRPEEAAHYDDLVRSGEFGRGDQRCPYYLTEGGLCGIWAHRNSACATWLCRHEKGGRGVALWADVNQWLAIIEDTLQRWVAHRLHFGHPPTPKEQAALEGGHWGPWITDIEGFYRACAAKVTPLSWSKIHALDSTRFDPTLITLNAALAEHDAPLSRGPLTYRGAITLETGPTGRTWLVSPAHRFTFEEVPPDLPKLLSTFVWGGYETLCHILKQAGAAEPRALAQRLIEDEVVER